MNSLALGQAPFISVAGSTIHASTCKRHCNRSLNGCRSKSQAYQRVNNNETISQHSLSKPHRSSQARVEDGCIDAKPQLMWGCRQYMHYSCCYLPASHSLESNSTGEEPCGQAQVYPPGRRRHRWLHTFLQGLETNDIRERKQHSEQNKSILGNILSWQHISRHITTSLVLIYKRKHLKLSPL